MEELLIDGGDLVLASGRWLDVGCYIPLVRQAHHKLMLRINSGIVALGMCGLFFDTETVAFTVELPVGFLERDSAIFKHKLDIALAALSVQPRHSVLGRSPNSRRRWPCALLRRYGQPL